MSPLEKKKCVPCVSNTSPLKGDILKSFYMQLDSGWQIIEEHYLERIYKFKNFAQALAFTNVIGKVAEEERHHPDIFLSWGLIKLKIYTHKINGLTESDFILSAKIEAEFVSHQG